MFHAFYSQQQEEFLNRNGLTANYYFDAEGTEIRITEVVSRNRNPSSKWEDLVYLGVVVKWSRSAAPIIDREEYENARQARLLMESYRNRESETINVYRRILSKQGKW